MRNTVIAVAAIFASLVGGVSAVRAEDPPVTPPVQAGASVSVESLVGAVYTKGSSQLPAFGARATYRHKLPGDFVGVAQVDGWAQANGKFAAVNLSDWTTFDSLDVTIAAEKEFHAGLAVIAFAGESLAVQSGRPVAASGHQTLKAAGIRIGAQGQATRLILSAGTYEPAGPGLHVVYSGRLAIAPNVAVIAEGAWAPHGWVSRCALAIGVL